jgi:hypothetical protein
VFTMNMILMQQNFTKKWIFTHRQLQTNDAER